MAEFLTFSSLETRNRVAVLRCVPMSLPALALSQDFSYAPDLLTITKEAFTVAKTAVSHAIDGLVNGSAAAFRAVKECEEQLDSFDRELDQRLGPAITQVNATEARTAGLHEADD